MPMPVAVLQVLEAVSALDPYNPHSRRGDITTVRAFETRMKLPTLKVTTLYCVHARDDHA